MEQSPSEAKSSSVSQEIPRPLWTSKVHCRVHKSPPFTPCPEELFQYFFHLRLALPNGLFPLGFPTKIFYAFLISPMRAKCPTRLIFLDLMTLIMFDEACKL